MSDCGCSGSSSSPPGTTPKSVNTPLGAASSFGGSAIIPRGTCGPAKCPEPPTSDSEVREPYCPSWVERLTKTVMGRLIVAVEGCLHLLKSKCTGYLFYDGDTEEVSVVNPPFVSSRPKEVAYGFLAKAVPTLTTVCVDGEETCRQEIRQEMAAQILGDATCGELVVANFPLCGELPADQSADAQMQTRFDYMKALDQEKAGCPGEIRFLAFHTVKRGTGNAAVDCKEWIDMRRLRMRGSQWNVIAKGNSLESLSKQVVVIPVAGGDPNDPCFEMAVLESGNAGLPDGAVECDTLIRRNVGDEDEGWFATPIGGRSFYFTTPKTLVRGFNLNLTEYQKYKDMGCSLLAIIGGQEFIGLSGSGAGGSGTISANGIPLGAGYSAGAGGFWLFFPPIAVPLTTNQINIVDSFSTAGVLARSSESYRHYGYVVGS